MLGLLIFNSVWGQEVDDRVLFQIERSRDSNKIYYEANLDEKGKLCRDEPIRIYWIKHAEQGQKAPLTWIQSQLAYGLEFLAVDDDVAEFRFVSHKKRRLVLRCGGSGFAVYLPDKGMQLEKVFVQINGESFLFPTIPYVKVYGRDQATQEQIEETIRP